MNKNAYRIPKITNPDISHGSGRTSVELTGYFSITYSIYELSTVIKYVISLVNNAESVTPPKTQANPTNFILHFIYSFVHSMNSLTPNDG